MKIFCQGQELSSAISTVIKAVSTKTTNPILEGVKITAKEDSLTLIGTDGELAIEKKIVADVKIEGKIVVPGRFFSEYIKRLEEEEIELFYNDKTNQVKVKYTDSEVDISCMNSSEFPSIQKIDNPEYFEIKEKQLKDIIQKTIFSVSTEDTRPVLKGCLFEIENSKLTSVALDGYRLALAKKDLEKTTSEKKIIVPGRSLNEISKLLEETDDKLKVYTQENYLMLQKNSTKVITRLLDGEFINYKQIIPSEPTSVLTVNKKHLEEALERASILSRESNENSVKFKITEEILTVEAKSEIGNVKENITTVLKGQDLEISFDARFIKSCLRVIADEFLKLDFTTSINPTVIKPNEGDDYLYLILPLKQQ